MRPQSSGSLSLRIPVMAMICALLVCATCLAQNPKVLAPHKPVAPRVPRHREWDKPAVSQAVTGGLWRTDGNFKSTVYLDNMLKEDSLTVTPVLHLANGVAYTLAPVTLEPSGTAAIDINQSLAKQGVAPYATLSGYVEVQYQWGWSAICGSVWNVDTTHSLIFVYSLRPAPVLSAPQDNQAANGNVQPQQTFEGMWWKEEPNVSGFVGLSNLTERPISASVQTLDAGNQPIASHSVTISPNGTKIVELTELLSTTASIGGVVVTWNGNLDELAVNSSLEDAAVGYSARMPLGVRPDASAKVSQHSYAELGLMTGPADPMMSFPSGVVFTPYSVLRNLSEQQVSVTPTIWWMQSGAPRSAQLPQLTLGAHQTTRLDMPALLTTAGLKNHQGSFNIVLDTVGPKGAVLLDAGSVDQSYTYVFGVVPRGVGESASKGMQYWSTANGDDTMVTLWNPADEAQDFVFTLFYTGGHYLYPIHLEARATHTFNVSEIIHSGIPDSEGNVIPAAIQSGSAEIAGLAGENQQILVALDSGIYNVRKATCGGVVCDNCNGFISIFLINNPFAVAVGRSTQEFAMAQWNTGTNYDYTNQSTWSSSNTGVATVNAGLFSGISPGQTGVAFTLLGVPPAATPCAPAGSPPPECPGPVDPNGGGTVNSTPRIDSISPTWGQVGKSVTVTISGSGFGTSPTIGLSGSGITVTYGSPRNDTSIAATFTIAPNASVGFQDVTVTNNTTGDGSTPTSSPVGFQVTPAVATPVNYHIVSESNLNDGSLFFTYTWSSSTGSQADLYQCTIGESVFYPNYPTGSYTWPLPMVQSSTNPTVLSGPGTYQSSTDTNKPPGGYSTPYSAKSFNATQRWWWSCSNYNNNATQTLAPDVTITRTTFKDTDGFWKYQITKLGYTNTVKLPNQ